MDQHTVRSHFRIINDNKVGGETLPLITGENNMFEKELPKMKINGVEYPYKFDICVLEKVQQKYGDVMQFEYGIRGMIPAFKDGVLDLKETRWTVPNIDMTCNGIVWMIQEGIEIAGSEEKAPDAKAIKRQDDYTITDLAKIVFEGYQSCFLSRTSRTKKAESRK